MSRTDRLHLIDFIMQYAEYGMIVVYGSVKTYQNLTDFVSPLYLNSVGKIALCNLTQNNAQPVKIFF